MLQVNYIHLFVFFVSATDTIAYKKIENYAGGRYTHFEDNEKDVVTITTGSMIQCSVMCTATEGCCTMGYKKSTKECKMNFDCCPAVKRITEGTETDFAFQKIPIKDNTPKDKPKDCSDLSDGSPSGVYRIHLSSSKSIKVHCDDGWTVIQRHKDPTFNFVRQWNDYKHGFGDVSLDHWLGNDNIHLLTSNNRTCGRRLKVVLSDWNGVVKSAVYNIFYIRDESSKYKIYARGGTGSLLPEDESTDFLGNLNDHAFSTIDQDNDVWSGHCAMSRQAGWWFHECGGSCFNCKIEKGRGSWTVLHWRTWFNRPYSLKSSIMLIK